MTITSIAKDEIGVVHESYVHDYLDSHPDAKAIVTAALEGSFRDGNSLIDAQLKPMIDWVFQRIRADVNPETLNADQAMLYIQELSVFARYNSQFLRRAGANVEAECFELAHEFRRNHLEEGGERGKVPAHYVLYSAALMSDLGILVNGRVPLPETHVLLTLHDLLVEANTASTICGGYYATEGVAVHETELLRDITNRYGHLVKGKTNAELPKLHYYYELHLEEDHEAAQVEGLSVEDAHIEGIAQFIRENDLFGMRIPEATDGFLQIMIAMTRWWEELTARARKMA